MMLTDAEALTGGEGCGVVRRCGRVQRSVMGDGLQRGQEWCGECECA